MARQRLYSTETAVLNLVEYKTIAKTHRRIADELGSALDAGGPVQNALRGRASRAQRLAYLRRHRSHRSPMILLTATINAFRALVIVVVAGGVYSRNPVAVGNGLFALSVSILPLVARFPRLAALWLGAVAVLHALGSVGLYHSVWWWDHLAHTASGGLVGAIGVATLRSALTAAGTHTSAATAFAFVVAFTLACGVLWELLEVAARDIATLYGLTPLLTPYGLRDVTEDILYDGVGAALAFFVAGSAFVPIADRLRFVRFPVLNDAFFALLVLVVVLAQGLELVERRTREHDAEGPSAGESVESDGSETR